MERNNIKNIHLIFTNKLSRLGLCNNKLTFLPNHQNILVGHKDYPTKFQHIYITNSEDIKKGDWFYYKHFGEDIISKVNENTDLVNINIHKEYFKKIILTTDTDLIEDGVQAIDDEFLEWFVKNPSCNEVEVDRDEREVGNHLGGIATEYGDYKLIIPKEEPKQETLEEAAERMYPHKPFWIGSGKSARVYDEFKTQRDSFIAGAKWQQEQDKKMYSEEDLINAFNEGQALNVRGKLIQGKEWFKQFKKK
jgi:hypothetical protein